MFTRKKLQLVAKEKGFETPQAFLVSELSSGKSIAEIGRGIGIDRCSLRAWAIKHNIERPTTAKISDKIKDLGYSISNEYFLKNWYKSFIRMGDELDSDYINLERNYSKFRDEILELKGLCDSGPFGK